jgi:uncharacterized membrane protein
VNLLVLFAGLGWDVSMNRFLPLLTGAFLILTGNLMGKVTTNLFVGVRTRWALADPEVWLRTQRFAGRAFIVGGLAIAVIGPLLGPSMWFIVLGVILSAIAPTIYSYYAPLRLKRARGNR